MPISYKKTKTFSALFESNRIRDREAVLSKNSVAVAVNYEENEMQVPEIAAVGNRKVAKMIREIGRRYGIPEVHDNRLAEKLIELDSQNSTIGMVIPQELFLDLASLFNKINIKK